MPEGLTSALSSIQPELQAGTQAASIGSAAYNMYNQYQNQQYQNQLRSYAQDPAKMNAYAANFTQPLNAGLTSAVANNTQGYLASRGLSDSPAVSQQVESQAIAPYIQQNQQAGYQDALQALQVGGGAVNPNSQSANSIAQLAKAFSTLGKLSPATATSAAQLQRTMGTQPQQLPNMYAPVDATYPGDPSWGDTSLGASASAYDPGLFPSSPDVNYYTPDYTQGFNPIDSGEV
jgi:hypothetical protein